MREAFGRNGATGREEGLGSDLSAVEGIGVVEDERAAVEVPVDLLDAQEVEQGRLGVRPRVAEPGPADQRSSAPTADEHGATGGRPSVVATEQSTAIE